MRLIDADALIKDLNEYKIPFNSDINEAIIFAPTIEAEPIRHGEWAVDTIYPSGVKKLHCSVCGQERTVHEEYEGVFRQNYCPNCGALMDKRET